MSNRSAPSAPPTAATAFFVDSWAVYQKLVAHNHMFHREIYAEVARLLAALPPTPIRLLDLGCGDVSQFAPVLRTLNLARYDGVDESAVALALAKQNLAGVAGEVHLHQADMLAFVETATERFDVIFSSFALHHLAREAKQDFLSACRQRLAPGGQLLLIDVARDEDQDLPAYLKAYCRTMARDWTSLNAEELGYVTTHVRENDKPERVSDLAAMAVAAGFAGLHPVARHTWHHVFSLRTGA